MDYNTRVIFFTIYREDSHVVILGPTILSPTFTNINNILVKSVDVFQWIKLLFDDVIYNDISIEQRVFLN